MDWRLQTVHHVMFFLDYYYALSHVISILYTGRRMMKPGDFILAALFIVSMVLAGSIYKFSPVKRTVLVCGLSLSQDQKEITTSAKIPFIECFPFPTSYCHNRESMSPAHATCPALASYPFLKSVLVVVHTLFGLGFLLVHLWFLQFVRCQECCLRLYTLMFIGFFLTVVVAMKFENLSDKISPTYIESCQSERYLVTHEERMCASFARFSIYPYLNFSLMTYGLSFSWLLIFIQARLSRYFDYFQYCILLFDCVIVLLATVSYFGIAYVAYAELDVAPHEIFVGSAIGGIMACWICVTKIMIHIIH